MLNKQQINALGMIITVAHSKGGVGKSTLVWNLAVMLHNFGVKITILDLDFQQTCSMANSIRTNQGVPPLNVIEIDDEVELQHYFNEWNEGILLVDIGAGDNALYRSAMIGSDLLITPLKPSSTELLGFKAFVQILEELDSPEIKVFFNNIHSNATKFDDIKEMIWNEYENATFFASALRNRGNFDVTLGEGKGVSEVTKVGSKESRALAIKSNNEIIHLVREIFNDGMKNG